MQFQADLMGVPVEIPVISETTGLGAAFMAALGMGEISSVEEMAELQAVDASFWYTYDELVQQKPEDLANVNDWRFNPMAALPVWLSIVARK